MDHSNSFDHLAKNYDEFHSQAIRLSGHSPAYFHEYKALIVANYLRKIGQLNRPLQLLNFGCGIGGADAYLLKHLPMTEILSIDPSEVSIQVAQKTYSNERRIVFLKSDGTDLPREKAFDVVFVANVFHHIPRHKHATVLQNIFSSIRPGGHLFLFEMNPLNPLTLWVALKADYRVDANTNLLSPWYTVRALKGSGFRDIQLKYSVFFPRPASALIPLEKYLAKMPVGAHFYCVATR